MESEIAPPQLIGSFTDDVRASCQLLSIPIHETIQFCCDHLCLSEEESELFYKTEDEAKIAAEAQAKKTAKTSKPPAKNAPPEPEPIKKAPPVQCILIKNEQIDDKTSKVLEWCLPATQHPNAVLLSLCEFTPTGWSSMMKGIFGCRSLSTVSLSGLTWLNSSQIDEFLKGITQTHINHLTLRNLNLPEKTLTIEQEGSDEQTIIHPLISFLQSLYPQQPPTHPYLFPSDNQTPQIPAQPPPLSTTLLSLNLASNKLSGSELFHQLLRTLPSVTTLQHLSLDNNGLTHQEIVKLANALSYELLSIEETKQILDREHHLKEEEEERLRKEAEENAGKKGKKDAPKPAAKPGDKDAKGAKGKDKGKEAVIEEKPPTLWEHPTPVEWPEDSPEKARFETRQQLLSSEQLFILPDGRTVIRDVPSDSLSAFVSCPVETERKWNCQIERKVFEEEQARIEREKLEKEEEEERLFKKPYVANPKVVVEPEPVVAQPAAKGKVVQPTPQVEEKKEVVEEKKVEYDHPCEHHFVVIGNHSIESLSLAGNEIGLYASSCFEKTFEVNDKLFRLSFGDVQPIDQDAFLSEEYDADQTKEQYLNRVEKLAEKKRKFWERDVENVEASLLKECESELSRTVPFLERLEATQRVQVALSKRFVPLSQTSEPEQVDC
ncbi:hypothetical protein BLNAU_13734 [Blattamonas nauphoetae]|uniref:Uncharacterized protein n=1 Tax=Blattamonas nauphoetae TaxID=2049346 RepID=A0ABQ9XMK1_9EUKA|nr:hypothetical protein BLNAU_13734 [Blattamonas nauphoetae]